MFDELEGVERRTTRQKITSQLRIGTALVTWSSGNYNGDCKYNFTLQVQPKCSIGLFQNWHGTEQFGYALRFFFVLFSGWPGHGVGVQ